MADGNGGSGIAAARRGLSRARLEGRLALRRFGHVKRPLPDFLIAGAAKAGTTSLHAYLSEHPAVSSPIRKEIHYFDLNMRRGEGWYRSHFPADTSAVTGESTPYYLFHPLVPERVAATLPEVKVIVLLRDPIDRAFSQHNHEVASGHESLSFERALECEAERLAGEEARLRADPGHRSFAHQHFSYQARGRYAVQLERWFEHFDRDRFLIIRAEDLFADPAAELAVAQRFLGLDVVLPANLTARNARRYAPIDPALRTRLVKRFRPENERLHQLIHRDFMWT